MGKKNKKRKLRGTSGSDELTGLISNQRIYGLAGDDIFLLWKVNLRFRAVRAAILLSPSMEGMGICR